MTLIRWLVRVVAVALVVLVALNVTTAVPWWLSLPLCVLCGVYVGAGTFSLEELLTE